MATLPNYIQLDSPLEFTRLVCALERSPRVSFLHEHNGKKVLSVQMDLLKEKPVIYFTPIENIGHYLCYGFNSGKEKLELVETTLDNSKLYSPASFTAYIGLAIDESLNSPITIGSEAE